MNDLWEIITSLPGRGYAVNVLFISIHHLLHTTILTADIVQDTFRPCLHIYQHTNGKEDPENMENVFVIKIQKHE